MPRGTQRRDVTFAVGMHSITEKDNEHLARRINPKRRSGETCVPKRAQRKQIAGDS